MYSPGPSFGCDPKSSVDLYPRALHVVSQTIIRLISPIIILKSFVDRFINHHIIYTQNNGYFSIFLYNSHTGTSGRDPSTIHMQCAKYFNTLFMHCAINHHTVEYSNNKCLDCTPFKYLPYKSAVAQVSGQSKYKCRISR